MRRDAGEELAAAFHTPPPGYGPVPLWFWNARLDEAELRRQIARMKEQHLTGFFLHARHGLQTPYLSDEWWRCVRVAVEAAAALGLEAHLYDEENWPSGTAGGRVTRENPALRGSYLRWTEEPWDPRTATDPCPPPGGRIEAVIAVPEDETGRPDFTSATVITPFSLAEKQGRLGDGRWCLFTFTVHTHAYIDVLNPAAVRRFIQLTHERYREVVGEYFGSVIPTVFHDEAGLLNLWTIRHPATLPWSPRLPWAFQQQHGYDVWSVLPQLVADAGPPAVKARQDFQTTLAELFEAGFYRPLAEWCEANHLALTGHLVEEEPLFRQVRQQADAPRMYRAMHLPGVDHLGVGIGGWHHKLASSVAHQHSRERVLSESWGASGWGRTLAERKRCVDWQLAQGINLFAPHALYYSVAGKRKRESPPSEFYQEPFWKYYHLFADYVARLCYALSRGQPGARVAVLYPLRSAWAHYDPLRQDPRFEEVENDLFRLGEALTRLHYEFDFLPEDALAEADVSQGRIRVGQGRYELLVLPSLTTLHTRSVEQIEQFLAGGGKLLAAGRLPDESERGPDAELAARVRGWWARGTGHGAQSTEHRAQGTGHRAQGTEHRARGAGHRARGTGHEALRQALHSLLPPDLVLGSEGAAAEQIVHTHRIVENLHLYFLVYTGEEEATVDVTLPVAGVPELWTAETGEVEPLPACRIEAGRTGFSLRFRPREARLIAVRPGGEEPNQAPGLVRSQRRSSAPKRPADGTLRSGVPDYKPVETLSLPNEWTIRRLEDNTLILSDWRFARCDEEPSPDEAAARCVEPLPARQDISWCPALEPLEAEIAPFVLYRTAFLVEAVPPALRLVLEPIDAPLEAFVNGRRVEPEPRGDLDSLFLSADLAGLVREGENEVVLRADYRNCRLARPDHRRRITGQLVPEPARLRGDFGLVERAGSWAVTDQEPDTLTVGSWAAQGYPHFSGTLEYAQTFDLPQAGAAVRWTLVLEDVRDVAEVWLNGRRVGAKAWPPYEFDLSAQAQAGPNRLAVRVTNTAINALLGTPQESGLLGRARIEGAVQCEVQGRQIEQEKNNGYGEGQCHQNLPR